MIKKPEKMEIKNVETLSLRARNALMANGILTVQDLIDRLNKYGSNALENIINIGKTAIDEINNFLSEQGFHINQQTEHIYKTQKLATIEIKYLKDLSHRAKNGLLASNIVTVQDIVDNFNKNGLNVLRIKRNVGKKTIDEINVFVNTFIKDYVQIPEKQKSNAKKYKLATARTKAEMAALENARKLTTKKQKEH